MSSYNELKNTGCVYMDNYKLQKKNENYLEFEEIIRDLINNPTVQKMDNFRQHYDTSCFTHCKNVAFYNYIICKKLGLDYISATRAGMLHDLFLYDWRINDSSRKGLHAFRHPKIAFDNSSEIFDLNEKEKDIILKHMWPLTLIPPKYLESFIITLVDKFCALQESYVYYNNRLKFKKSYRYAYVFLSLIFLRIL